jgi:hypothetical protein
VADFRQTVESSKGGFEKLVSQIPGYHGYKEKENRRAADKLLREHLYAEFDSQRRRLIELQRQLVEGGGLMVIDDLDRATLKVQKLGDAIRTASYGYGGLFDAVTVKEDRLDALYAFDQGMLDQVSAIQKAVDALAGAVDTGGDVKAGIQGVMAAAEAANSTWRQRQDALTGAS